MKAYLMVTVCLSVLVVLLDGVTVKVGYFSFPLESVKQLKDLLDVTPRNPRMRSGRMFTLCSDPKLPKEFMPVCASPNAGTLFQTLEIVTSDVGLCEICANVACSGC